MEKTNAMRLLDAAGIAYEGYNYTTDDGQIDGISVAKKLALPQEIVYKTLVAENPSHEHFVFMIPVAEELDLKKAAKAAGQKSIELIPVKDILKTTGYIRGGCSPLGMKKPFPTFIQEDAMLYPHIVFSGGRIGAQIQLNGDVLCQVAGGVYADLCK